MAITQVKKALGLGNLVDTIKIVVDIQMTNIATDVQVYLMIISFKNKHLIFSQMGKAGTSS